MKLLSRRLVMLAVVSLTLGSSPLFASPRLPTPTVAAQAAPPVPADNRSGDDKLSKNQTILLGILSPLVSLLGAILTIIYFYKNRKLSKDIADRTVTIEAQKMLLEINKQYLSDPALFAIYDDWPRRQELLKDPKLPDKLKAMAYLKLNVFEVVYAVMPEGGAWKAFFHDSLEKCSVLRHELDTQAKIYDANLIAAYGRWKAGYTPPTKAQATPPPPRPFPVTTPVPPKTQP